MNLDDYVQWRQLMRMQIQAAYVAQVVRETATHLGGIDRIPERRMREICDEAAEVGEIWSKVTPH